MSGHLDIIIHNLYTKQLILFYFYIKYVKLNITIFVKVEYFKILMSFTLILYQLNRYLKEYSTR